MNKEYEQIEFDLPYPIGLEENEPKTPIADMLNRGKNRAKNLEELMRAFPSVTRRQLFKMIEHERRKAGAPILASKKAPTGYYLPSSDEEFEEYINIRRAELEHDRETTEQMKKAWPHYWKRKLLNEKKS